MAFRTSVFIRCVLVKAIKSTSIQCDFMSKAFFFDSRKREERGYATGEKLLKKRMKEKRNKSRKGERERECV